MFMELLTGRYFIKGPRLLVWYWFLAYKNGSSNTFPTQHFQATVCFKVGSYCMSHTQPHMRTCINTHSRMCLADKYVCTVVNEMLASDYSSPGTKIRSVLNIGLDEYMKTCTNRTLLENIWGQLALVFTAETDKIFTTKSSWIIRSLY